MLEAKVIGSLHEGNFGSEQKELYFMHDPVLARRDGSESSIVN